MKKILSLILFLCAAIGIQAQIDNSKGDPILSFEAIGAKLPVIAEDTKITTQTGSCTFEELINGKAPEGMLDNVSELFLQASNGIEVQIELFRGDDTFDALNKATQWQMRIIGDMYANLPEGQRSLDYGFQLNVDTAGVFSDSGMRISGLVPNNGNPKYASLYVCYLRYCDVYVLVVVNGPEMYSEAIKSYIQQGAFSNSPGQFSGKPLTVEEMAEKSDGIHYSAVFFGNLFGFTYGEKYAEHRDGVRATPYAYYKELFGVNAPSYRKEYGNVPDALKAQLKEQADMTKSKLAEQYGVKKLIP